jgi:L-idonate 5-dehydrogenase
VITTAHAATLFGADDLRVVERPLGPPADGMVRIKLRAGGICGSDLHYFRHGRTGDFVLREPLVLGHELAGEIFEINAPSTGLTIGDHVAVNPSRRCNACPRCLEGRSNLCENIFFMGSASKNPHMQGGFSTYFDTTPGQCIVVPKSVPMSAIAMAEPLAVCLHAVARAGDLTGKSIAIFGGGPIGLLTLLSAQVAGIANATMIDLADRPLALASSLGADQTFNTSAGADALVAAAAGAPFDIVFEVTGALPALSLAVRTVRRGGTVVQVGNLPGGDVSLPANMIMTKELDYRGTMRFHDEFDKAVELIVSGQVDVQKIITGSLPIDEAVDAFRLALDRSQSVKVVLEAA